MLLRRFDAGGSSPILVIHWVLTVNRKKDFFGVDLQNSDLCSLKGRHRGATEQMGSSGLLRYRSAPSTLLGDVCEEFLPHRSTNPEPESMFARFMGEKQQQPSSAPGHRSTHPYMPPVDEEVPEDVPPHSSTLHMLFHHPQQQHQQIQSLSSAPTCAVESPYLVMGSMPLSEQEAAKGGGSSGLIRHSSSPAGLFSNLSADSGGGSRCYISAGYPLGSLEDPVFLPDGFSGSKRARDPSEAQNGEMRNNSSGLTHHFSLPKSFSDMSSMEKFVQFPDAVPCKLRAKRGHATHPRSIAERVRRTKISERMRKLQELVPNMDKQTNTADMLDLAVDYIKNLQKNVKTLSDERETCTCCSKRKS